MEVSGLAARSLATLLVASAAHALPAARAHRSRDARVLGTFVMRARVTVAVGVVDEQAGEILTRRWVIVARGCHEDRCSSLLLLRQRGDGRSSRITLRPTGPDRYAGRATFEVALLCAGRVYRNGSRAPYRIALRVTRTKRIGGIRFAQAISATYVNPARSDSTPCPLAPSHDAAVYTGRLIAGLPSAPTARFAARVRSGGIVRFRSRSRPGRGNGRLVQWAWSFGDPGSPYGEMSTRRAPRHVYSTPGRYVVRLRVMAADGLSATRVRMIRVARRSFARSSRAPA